MYSVHGHGFGDLGSAAGAFFTVLGQQAGKAAVTIAAGAASTAIETKILGDYQKRLANMEEARTRTQAELAERYAQQAAAIQQAQDQQEHLQSKEMLELESKLAQEAFDQQYRAMYGQAPGTAQSAPSGSDQAALLMLLQQQQALEQEATKKDKRKKALWWGLGGAGVGLLVVGGAVAYALTRG